MTLLRFLAGYATSFAVVMYALEWIRIVVLGRLEADFGGVAGNLQATHQIIVLVVPFATLLAAFGVPHTHQEWVRRHAGTAIAVGAASGTLTVVVFYAMGAASYIAGAALPEGLRLMLFLALRIVVVGVPTLVTHVFVRLAHRTARV